MKDSIPPAVAPASNDASGFSWAFPLIVEDEAAADSVQFARDVQR